MRALRWTELAVAQFEAVADHDTLSRQHLLSWSEYREPAERGAPRLTGQLSALASHTVPKSLMRRLLASARPVAYSQVMDYRERITIEPGKRSGKPCIRGLRITVYDVLDYLASGMSEDQILADFPDLEREDIRAALAFAADRERRLIADPAA